MKKAMSMAGMGLVASACMLGALHSYAQEYPTKPIRMVVAFSPGGAPDLIGRLLGQKLNEKLGQTIIVDNRPGATGNIGAEIVANATADGYTVFMATLSLAISPSFYSKLPFDPVKSFVPIGMVASVPLLLVVHPSLPARSVKELIALAKSKPGVLNYASVGNGSPQHLSGELFKSVAGLNIVHVPYKGGGPATVAVLSGEANLFFAGMPPALPYVKSGRLRALAVSTIIRSPSAPEVLTMSEAGLSGFEADNWNALLAPRGTPQKIVNRLNQELEAVLNSPDTKAALILTGSMAAYSTPDELASRIKAETVKWSKVARAAGVKPE
ncbi:MAG: tripartite tricarboxylate transporter substrate binding protein [Gallionellaceae bacterium]|nr:tripartite tricarboxylate transporter substrate binding protein [Gallionellaceae bacterium]